MPLVEYSLSYQRGFSSGDTNHGPVWSPPIRPLLAIPVFQACLALSLSPQV